MSLSRKRIIWTYVLCLLGIPMLVGLLWGAVWGVKFGQKIGAVDASDPAVQEKFAYYGIEDSKDLAGLPEDVAQEVYRDVYGIDFIEIEKMSNVVRVAIMVLTGFAAGYFLRSKNHLLVIAGISWVFAMLPVIPQLAQSFTLVFKELLYIFILVAAGYGGMYFSPINDSFVEVDGEVVE